jgi:hypothetical protein
VFVDRTSVGHLSLKPKRFERNFISNGEDAFDYALDGEIQSKKFLKP